jgi:hypothetical protein
VAYRDDPTIFGWELINEPRCPSDPSGETLKVWIFPTPAFSIFYEDFSKYGQCIQSWNLIVRPHCFLCFFFPPLVGMDWRNGKVCEEFG